MGGSGRPSSLYVLLARCGKEPISSLGRLVTGDFVGSEDDENALEVEVAPLAR